MSRFPSELDLTLPETSSTVFQKKSMGANTKTYVLPKYFYLVDARGRYLRCTWYAPGYSPWYLSFATECDQYCQWQADPVSDTPGAYTLRHEQNFPWHLEVIDNQHYMRMRYQNSSNITLTVAEDQSVWIQSGDYWLGSSTDGVNGIHCSRYAMVKYTVVDAAMKIELWDFKYDLVNATTHEEPPTIALDEEVQNNSSVVTTQLLSYSYEQTKAGIWDNEVAGTLGVKMTFKEGLPFVAPVSAKYEVSVGLSDTYTFGGSETQTTTTSASTTVTVPPKTRCRARVVVENCKIDVKFTYNQKKWFMDGTSEYALLNGIYTNVDSFSVDVQLEKIKDM